MQDPAIVEPRHYVANWQEMLIGVQHLKRPRRETRGNEMDRDGGSSQENAAPSTGAAWSVAATASSLGTASVRAFGMRPFPAAVRGARVGFFALIAGGAALRVGFNSVKRFGCGDEYHYCFQVRAIHENGWSCFPKLARWHLASEPDFPAPYRWGVLFFGNLACALRGSCDERTLAWLSSVAGIAVVTLVALIAVKLFSRRTAFVATALALTSPLHLELGRRAYADELHTALLLLSLLALTHVAMDRPHENSSVSRRLWTSIAILALTFAWSVKESVAFLVPALGLWLYALRSPKRLRWSDGVLLALPPAIAFFVLVAFNRGFSHLGALLRATRDSLSQPYSATYQQGPPHRPLIELFTLSPGVFALLPVVPFAALGFAPPKEPTAEACGSGDVMRRRAQGLVLVFLAIVVAFAFLPKNLRFYGVLDPLARLLVAWLIAEVLPWGKASSVAWCASILAGNAALELAIFHRTFVTSAVTDPTASAIFDALQLTPSEARRWHPPLLVNGCALVSMALAWTAAYLAKFKGKSVLVAIVISVSVLVTPQLFRPMKAPRGAALLRKCVEMDRAALTSDSDREGQE